MVTALADGGTERLAVPRGGAPYQSGIVWLWGDCCREGQSELARELVNLGKLAVSAYVETFVDAQGENGLAL